MVGITEHNVGMVVVTAIGIKLADYIGNVIQALIVGRAQIRSTELTIVEAKEKRIDKEAHELIEALRESYSDLSERYDDLHAKHLQLQTMFLEEKALRLKLEHDVYVLQSSNHGESFVQVNHDKTS